MTPIDPVIPARENNRSMEPPFADENPNLEAVREGLGVAEDEARNDVEETYQTSADDEDIDADFFDDDDELTGEEKPYAPELAAMHEGRFAAAPEDFEKESDSDEPDKQVELAEEYRPDEDDEV